MFYQKPKVLFWYVSESWVSSKKSLVSEDRVEYEYTSEILVKVSLIFTGAELLATSHIIIITKTIKVIKEKGKNFEKSY